MNKTNIEWTDFVCNPWRQRCKKHCWYCYAWKYYPRYGIYEDEPEGLHRPTLKKLWSRKKPTRIFMGSMTDLLGEWVPSKIIMDILDAVEFSNDEQDREGLKHHTFIFLTKNWKRYLEFDWPENCWLGATATDGESFGEVTACLSPLANTTFVSVEPILARIDPEENFRASFYPGGVVIGALTGVAAKRRPKQEDEREWIEELVDWCATHRIPVRVKDNVGYDIVAGFSDEDEEFKQWPDHVEEFPA